MRIHRTVKMYFQEEKIDDFLSIFNASKDKIRQFPGCLSLQLIQDIDHPYCIGTSSIWESSEDLENYRKSELFRDTWAKTKVLFQEKPEASSYYLIHWLP